MGVYHKRKIEVCSLYEMGYDRVGCIGCPMAGKKRYKEFFDFPKYKQMYLNAFERMLKELDRKGKSHTWETAEDVYRWWLEDETVPGQLEFDINGEIREATI